MDEENASSLASSLERIATAFERLASTMDEINVYGVRLGLMEGHSLPLRSHDLFPLKVQLQLDEDEND